MLNIYLIALLYTVIFLFGALGNAYVMVAMIYSKLCCIPRNNRSCSPRERSRIFIFLLAVADFIVLCTVPFSLWQILGVRWSFGSLLCKLHAAIDSSGKSMSLVLLTAMSIERYLIVCTRWRYISSPMRISLVPILIGVVFVVLSIIPQILYTNLYTITLEKDGHVVNETVCLHIMPEEYVPLYANYTFVFSFAFPLLIMSFCYLLLVRHVRRKFHERVSANRSSASSIRINRPKYLCGLTRSICRIAVFHGTCWTPFWIFTLAPIYASAMGYKFPTHSQWFQDAKIWANVLPYINSAGNCVFYAFLNRDVRQQIWRPSSRLRSGYTATAIQSATMSFNNPASDCNESN